MNTVRKLFCFFLFISVFSSLSFTSSPMEIKKINYNILIYEFKGLTFTVDRESSSKIETCYFNEKNKDFHIASKKVISFIQVLNPEGEIYFQLPLNSTDLHINMNDFDLGEYQLNFKFSSDEEFSHGKLIKKE